MGHDCLSPRTGAVLSVAHLQRMGLFQHDVGLRMHRWSAKRSKASLSKSLATVGVGVEAVDKVGTSGGHKETYSNNRN